MQFIEGGWPGANPKDIEFFRIIKTVPLKHASVVAFGSTRKATNPVQKDATIQALLSAETQTITIFGKSWTFQVTDALSISLAKNLELISDSIQYPRSKGRRVFYDAEHFFDGYKANPDYALNTVRAAVEAGADRVILCDTNGGTMPWEVRKICEAVKQEFPVALGIHAHNDSEMAVAILPSSPLTWALCRTRGLGAMESGNDAATPICVRSSRIWQLSKMVVRPGLGDRLQHLKEVSGFVTRSPI